MTKFKSNSSEEFLFLLLALTFLLSSRSGYGMSGDLKCLLATWHQFLEEPLKMEGMLDLLNIHQKVHSHNFMQITSKLNSAVE